MLNTKFAGIMHIKKSQQFQGGNPRVFFRRVGIHDWCRPGDAQTAGGVISRAKASSARVVHLTPPLRNTRLRPTVSSLARTAPRSQPTGTVDAYTGRSRSERRPRGPRVRVGPGAGGPEPSSQAGGQPTSLLFPRLARALSPSLRCFVRPLPFLSPSPEATPRLVSVYRAGSRRRRDCGRDGRGARGDEDAVQGVLDRGLLPPALLLLRCRPHGRFSLPPLASSFFPRDCAVLLCGFLNLGSVDSAGARSCSLQLPWCGPCGSNRQQHWRFCSLDPRLPRYFWDTE